MKQNLNFMIRGASESGTFFAYNLGRQYQAFALGDVALFYDVYQYQCNQSSTNFEEFSFLHHGLMDTLYDNSSLFQLDNLWPFTANYDLANYFVDTTRTHVIPFGSTNFNFQPNFNTNIPAPPILAHADPYWILQAAFYPTYWWPDLVNTTNWAVTVTSTQTVATAASGKSNLFGLPFQTGCEVDMVGGGLLIDVYCHYQALAPGNSVTANPGYLIGDYATRCPPPTLQLVDYYFAPLINPQSDAMDLPGVLSGFGGGQLFPLPIDDHFNVTNQTPQLMACAVGQPMILGSWAKYSIQGSSPAKYAYLGQYFTNAYKIGTNGVATTNQTGILSPYGEFFPTEPGPVALVTMPDIDTGQSSTGVVNVIKLQLDVNHDGIMDLTFGGPDNTSQARPFVFWINNDWDLGDSEPGHDFEGQSKDADDSFINSQRDLEDFSRLWVCGVPALTNEGFQVTLEWGSISSSNPAINLFKSVEMDGGIGYLTNASVAAAQTAGPAYTGPGWKIGTVSPGQSFTFPTNFFANSGTKYFLFEGAGVGSGELVLTVSKGTNVLAQTSAWLDLHDIKDFYEAAKITNNMSGAISNWSSAVERVMNPQLPDASGDQNLIVLVHGINVGDWDWVNDSETVYKRLYWAGYQGKFATVKWPCNYLTPPRPVTFDVFNLSELQAYKASQALTNYLNQLRARFPDSRLHLLVHSQGNAIVSEALTRSGVSVANYILTQGAISAGAYDVNATNYADFMAQEVGTHITPEWQPMGYRGIYTNLTGRIVNFYNPNDGVLAIWKTDQIDDKPGKYTYDGTNCWYVDFFFIKHLVTDQQEARAMVSRSRTLSIGQSGPASGHGVIQSAVDLNVQYGFNSDISEHSAQWSRPIQTSLLYYKQILLQIQPPP